MADGSPRVGGLPAAELEAILRGLAGPTAPADGNGRPAPAAPPATPPPARPAPAPAAEPALVADTLRALLEAVPDALVVVDHTGRIVLVNAQTEAMFGYRRDELAGQFIEVLVPERFRETHVGQRDGYFVEPTVRPIGMGRELVGRRKDGHEVPVEISLTPLRTPDGLLVVSTVRDVTERRRAGAQLRKMEARYRTLVEGIPAVTFMAPMDEGPGRGELYVSPQIERLLGFSQREWVENPILWYTQLHPDDQQRWHDEFARTVATGEPFQSVYRFVARDGRVVWVHGEAQVVRDEAGRPLFLQGVAFDITGIKQAEEELKALNATLEQRVSERTAEAEARAAALALSEAALRESEERHRLLVNGVRDYAIFRLDVDGRIASWNRGAERIKGYAGEEIVGRHFSVFYPPEDVAAGKTDSMLRIAETAGRVEDEGWRVRKDGSKFWANVVITALRGADGRLTGFAKVTRDRTEQRLAEEAIRRARDELEDRAVELARSNEALKRFAVTAAHDLKAPLVTVQSYTQLLAEEYRDALDERGHSHITRVVNAAVRMKTLINDLEKYSLVRTERTDPLPVACSEALEWACANLGVQLDEVGAEVTAGELPTVLADRTQLGQLFQNLIGNALKYRSEAPPRVHVSARREGAEWVIGVTDNGVGIKAEYLQKIFDLGIRSRVNTKIPGSGIGLTTCETIVQRHGGRIWASSDGPGKGTTISFTMPAAE